MKPRREFFLLVFALAYTLKGYATDIRLEGKGFARQPSRPLNYANPILRPSSQFSEIQNIDQAIAKANWNLETERFNTDSIGISHASFTIDADSDSALPSLRNRIVPWLDAVLMRYGLDESRSPKNGPIERIRFSLEYVVRAEAYFTLRDSLLSLRSPSIRVKVDESPLQRSAVNWDSLHWFLNSFKAASMKDKAEVERYFLTSFARYGTPLSYTLDRGLSCHIEIRGPLSQTESAATPKPFSGLIACGLRARSDQPLVAQMQNVENSALLSLGIAALSLLLNLILVAFLIWKWRRRKPIQSGA